jgi:chemotaxis protein CheC
MGMMLLPSPPSLAMDISTAVLTMTNPQVASEDRVLCVESEFLMKDSEERLRGLFLLLPDPASLTAILRAVRVA